MVANLIEAARRAEHRIVIERTFDAPRELVYRAWTDAKIMMKWMCPTGFTVLFAEADPRVGGKWRSGMRSPDGGEFIHHGEYLELVRPSRIVMTHTWAKNHLEPKADTLITITLTEHAGKTVMVFEHAGFATAESAKSHHGGWSGAFDNIAKMIAQSE